MLFLQQIINGMTLGSIYALIAIGYTMVYGITGLINFAHGEIFMLSAYIALLLLLGLAGVGWPLLLVIPLVLMLAMAFTGLHGWALERVAYRPVRNQARLVALISAIGMSLFLQNYLQLAQGARDISLPPLIEGGWLFGGADSFQVRLSYLQLLIAGTALLMMTGLALFISRSRLGQACRACAEDIRMVSLLGIDVNRVIALAFVMGAALAAVAGFMVVLYYGRVNPYIGFIAGLKAFTAAVLGGIGSVPGAMLGGFILGLAESFASAYLRTEYKDVVSFSLLVLVLLFRPTGLLGRPAVEKV